MVQAQYEQDPANMQAFLHDIKSRMTEEQYQEFLSRMEAEEFGEDYDDEDIEQMERDVRRHGGLDEEEEDF
jgi:hypothetical protein